MSNLPNYGFFSVKMISSLNCVIDYSCKNTKAPAKIVSIELRPQGLSDHSISAILQYYAAATENDPTWYKAWHAWAVMNFETVLHYKRQAEAGAAAAAGMVARWL